MSKAVNGDPSIDIRATQILDNIKELSTATMLRNLDGDLLYKIEEAAGILQARAGKYWKVRFLQGEGRSKPRREANRGE